MLRIDKKHFLITLVLFFSACASQLKVASQIAQVDANIYTAITSQAVDMTTELVLKSRQNPLPADEKATLAKLNSLNQKLEIYAQVHNAYVQALQIWQTSGTKPANMDALTSQLTAMINDLVQIATSLGFVIPNQGG
jgi:hypothetical protein